MKTLIIDNYDSFTWNLFQIFAELGGHPEVIANDALSLNDVKKISPTHIVISPGPGTVEKKEDFGICEKIIQTCGKTTPLLGVCLGHQGIAHSFGAKIIHAPEVCHGKVRDVTVKQTGIFTGCPKIMPVMRYHSLIVDEKTLPKEILVTARTVEDNLIMALQHKKFPIYGIQFHPESFATPHGKRIIQNFLYLKR